MSSRHLLAIAALLSASLFIACSEDPSSPKQEEQPPHPVSYHHVEWSLGDIPCPDPGFCLSSLYISQRGDDPPKLSRYLKGELGQVSQSKTVTADEFWALHDLVEKAVHDRDRYFDGCEEFEGQPEMIGVFGGDAGWGVITEGCLDADLEQIRAMARSLIEKYFEQL